VTDDDPKDRDVAMVFQNYALYPHMTVAQNMGFALKVARIAKAEIHERILGTWIANPRICPAANVNGWRWEGRSCGARKCS
jgi:ABC-type nitrate/sulfonate/bicarbonate transport system ATPase subunit